MPDILITGGTVIPIDPARRIIPDGAVAITGDRIVAVGSRAELPTEAGTVIDASGMVVLPGLIDGHAHAGHALMKTVGAGDGGVWNESVERAYTVGSTEAFWHAEAQLAALERLRFGVTTGVSLLGGGDSVMRTDEPGYADAHCDGVLGIGTRSVVAIGPTRPPHPRTYARWEGNTAREYPVSFAQQMETCATLIGRWHGTHGNRIRMAMLTPTIKREHVQNMPAELLEQSRGQVRAARAMSREAGVLFTQDGHGTGSVVIANELGILGPDALFSHATDLLAEEIALCAASGTRIAHNPSANASIMGRCPAPELLEAGAVVCLGSDATAPDRSGDMFRHMQQCMHYHRRHFRDPKVLPPGKVLEMCTIDAALALGMQDEVGSLEPGKKADVVLLDMRRPHIYPLQMPEYRTVYFANGNDVHTVIVDGVVRLRDRKAVGVNEDVVLDAAQREAELAMERLGLGWALETAPRFWGHVRG